MKKLTTIVILILITINAAMNAMDDCGADEVVYDFPKDETSILADSIMRMVIDNASRYQNLLESSESEIYIKGVTEVLKKNRLFRYAHHVFPVNRRPKDMVFEMVSQSKFEPPNVFVHHIEAINGSSIPNSKKQKEVIEFLNMNVYSSTAFNDAILMPVAKNAFKYYTFKVIETRDTAGLNIFRIRFLPKQLSQKLISGDLYIVDKVWTIDEIDISGRYAFADFNLMVSYGRGYNRFNLPEKADLQIRYKLFGNVLVNMYHAKFKYKSIVWSEEGPYRNTRRTSLDLTGYYRLSSDTVPIITDSAYWQSKRDIPLSDQEDELYSNVTDKRLQAAQAIDTTDANKIEYLELTQKLTNTVNMNYKATRIRYSGFLNPFQLGYSGSNGITYRQRLRINKTFSDGKKLYFRPEVGYLFGRKEFYFKVLGEWLYSPERMGSLSLLVGNGNQSYSSEMMKDIKDYLKGDTLEIEDLNLQYFRHYYIELKNRFELTNGFQLNGGITYNHRNPVKRIAGFEVGDEIIEIVNEDYNDFTPFIGFSFTPQQYYRMDGKRKEYVYSYYPTLSVEFSRAFPGVLKGDGDFARFEVDLHQNVSLGLLRHFNYHLSAGKYTKQKSKYFADFRYFTRRNFPDSWDDQIGGVFNLLRREWFNASDQYIQAHVMYQTPFIFLPFLSKKLGSKYVFYERLYLSQLWLPALPSYTELGYGIGNHIFNLAGFIAFDKLDFYRVGVKFSFELF